jgi:hypothetical protein
MAQAATLTALETDVSFTHDFNCVFQGFIDGREHESGE